MNTPFTFPEPSEGRQGLRWAVTAMTVLLLVQFLLGMATNLFAKIHIETQPQGGATGASNSSLSVDPGGAIFWNLHMFMAVLLALLAAAILILAIGRRARLQVILAVVGALAILGAVLTGLSFLGGAADRDSFLMSVCFAVALAAYVTALVAPAGGRTKIPS